MRCQVPADRPKLKDTGPHKIPQLKKAQSTKLGYAPDAERYFEIAREEAGNSSLASIGTFRGISLSNPFGLDGTEEYEIRLLHVDVTRI